MISFSGIDCAGKSTQLEIIKKCLDKKGIKSRVIWSRGGYTSWIEGIKNLLRKDTYYSDEQKQEYREAFKKSSMKQKLLLWSSICDLIRYYGIVFRFIEMKGTLILCDRYIWDTYIDFKMKYPTINFEKWFIWKLMIKTIKKPKVSIIFTIPIDVSMQRSIEKDDPHSEPYDFRYERLKLYQEEINNGRWQHVIDAEMTIDKVAKEVRKLVLTL